MPGLTGTDWELFVSFARQKADGQDVLRTANGLKMRWDVNRKGQGTNIPGCEEVQVARAWTGPARGEI